MVEIKTLILTVPLTLLALVLSASDRWLLAFF